MRHYLALLHLCVWMCAALVSFSHVDAHVLGVDFGTEYIKVAGPHGTQNLDIVLNEYSQRKTANFIAQRHGDWHIGDHAQNIAARFPLNYACALNQLLGLHVNSNNSVTEEHFTTLSYKYRVVTSERGTALVPLEEFVSNQMNTNHNKKLNTTNNNNNNNNYKDRNNSNSLINTTLMSTDNDLYSAEELYALVLKHLNKMAINDGVLAPSNMVVTIPFHTPLRTRRAIVEAAEMAGVQVSALIPHTMAAAFYYGVRHRGFKSETVHIIIFDIGASHVEAGLYQFTPPARLSSTKGTNSSLRAKRQQRNVLSDYFGTLTALAVFDDYSVGGRALDLCVANLIEEAAVNSLHIDPILNNINSNINTRNTPTSLQSLKAHFSLLRAAKKTREILSANSHAFYVVEGITSGKDFHGKLTRVEYETRCKHVFDKFTHIATQVWNVAREKKMQVTAFEMMGGVTRTPRVLQDIATAIGRPVDRTLNSDEAGALGAAYVAVRDSPFYNVKSFAMNNSTHADAFFYMAKSVEETHDMPNATLRKRLFRSKDATGHKTTTLTFAFMHDFDIYVYTSNSFDNTWQFTGDINTAHFIDDVIHHTDTNDSLNSNNNINQSSTMIDSQSYTKEHTVNAGFVKHVDKLAKVNMPPVAVIKVTQVHEALTRLRFFELEDNRSNKTHVVRLHVKVTDTGLIELVSASVVMHYTVIVEYKPKNASSIEREGNSNTSREHNVTAAAKSDNGSKNSSNASSNNNDNRNAELSQNENSNFSSSTTSSNKEEILNKDDNQSRQENSSDESDNINSSSIGSSNNNHYEKNDANNILSSIHKHVKIIPKSKSARVYAEISWLSPREVSDEEMLLSKHKMERIEAEEHAKREKALARNNLEAYIFWMKNDGILQNDVVKAASPAELLQRATERVMETKDWLEIGDGSKESCALSELKEKLNELTAIGNELLEYAKEDTFNTRDKNYAINVTDSSSAQKEKEEWHNELEQEYKLPYKMRQEQHNLTQSELEDDKITPEIDVHTDLEK